MKKIQLISDEQVGGDASFYHSYKVELRMTHFFASYHSLPISLGLQINEDYFDCKGKKCTPDLTLKSHFSRGPTLK